MIYKIKYAKERFLVNYLKDSINAHTPKFVKSIKNIFIYSDSLESKEYEIRKKS
jgi:hypothetical protein